MSSIRRTARGLSLPARSGFTIVELLIVIVVIAILAAITIVAYNGIQDRTRQSKISADLRMLEKAVHLARVQANLPLINITGSNGTAGSCVSKPSGTDLAALPKTDTCWSDYLSALDKISTTGSSNVRGLVDPWGRPYYIDENEYEASTSNCTKDHLAVFQQPFVGGTWTAMSGTDVWVANSMPNC